MGQNENIKKMFIPALRKKVDESTQARVADKLGLDQSTLSNILSGKSGMRADTLVRILRLYPELATVFFGCVILPETFSHSVDDNA